MNYVEVTVTTTNDAEELVSDIFWQFTDYGVAISNVLDVAKILQGEVIYDYFDQDILNGAKGVSLVKGYFEQEDAEEKIKMLGAMLDELRKNSCFEVGTLELIKRVVDGDDWLTIWKKHFKPVTFDKITICPEWIKSDNLSGIVVKINSDMAFGTGEHETTSMILDEMQKYISKDINVLDVGTGSGILGITASKLGARSVTMTDIDAVACRVAEKNVLLNSVDNCNVLCQGDLENIGSKFDLIVANITCEVLCLLSGSMKSVLSKDGVMILSGILNDRVDKVINAFCDREIKLINQKSIGEWTCITIGKK